MCIRQSSTQRVIGFFLALTLCSASGAFADSRTVHGGRAADVAESQTYMMTDKAQEPLMYPVQQRFPATANGSLPGLDDDDEYLSAPTIKVSDPFEPWNRFWYHANDILYMQLLKPLHETYVLVTPKEVRSGINNFFHNLLFPVRFVNCLLQGDFYDAGVQVSRFVINSTLGIGGIFDVTKNDKVLVPVNNVPKDFGSTLAYWGVGEGPFFIIPVFGPSTIRDTVGLGADTAATPTTYLPLKDGGAAMLGLRAMHAGDTSLAQYEAVRKLSIEPYVALRSAYLQNRRHMLERAGISQ